MFAKLRQCHWAWHRGEMKYSGDIKWMDPARLETDQVRRVRDGKQKRYLPVAAIS